MPLKSLALAAALLASSAAVAGPLDDIAVRYVKLSLEAGEREPGYVDAYYGPKEWADAAKKSPREVPALRAEAKALATALAAIDPATLDDASKRRRVFLQGQVKAAETRLAMLSGEKFSFADEAEGLFGIRPQLKPLASYDAALARLESIVPGTGPLAERMDTLSNRYVVPREKLEAVMREAIAGCRANTLRHIKLPANEKFDLEFVTNQPWSGYNWYKGNAHSLIQVNTDQPVRIGRAIDLGCHEGYPGHHALNMLLEEKLSKGRNWIEFTVYPLYSPQSLIAEGSANYGIDLAFPGAALAAFEKTRLYPLADLDPASADALSAVRAATHELSGATMTIDQMYLDGQINRDEAVRLTQRYGLTSEARAKQSLDFVDRYRSYVINYGLGQDMVRAHVERGNPDEATKWRRMEAVISEPTTPADLAR